MNSCIKTVVSVAVCSALISCGGSGGEAPQRTTLSITGSSIDSSANGDVSADSLVANDVATGAAQSSGSTRSAIPLISGTAARGDESLLLDGKPMLADANVESPDLIISNASAAATERGIAFTFDVGDSNGGAIPLDSLSIALEIASTGSFAESYTIPVYDIRQVEGGGDNSLSARTTAAELPAASYDARLVVNPNWQQHFDVLPAEHNHTQPFRYVDESDYTNNASNIFQVSTSGSTECVEDSLENNNSVASATPIEAGGRIEASLCLDNVDFYSVVLSENQSTSLTFAYMDEDTNQNPATRYVVLDSSFKRITEPTVAREANRISITSTAAGQYYVAMFGKRSSYRLIRSSDDVFDDDVRSDSLFHPETIAGPQSWLYGDVTLHRLAFTEATLRDQVINCGRITTQYRDEFPVAYITPDHFADIHEFRFLSDGGYLVDGERHNGWHVQDGDISHADWYSHSYPGYAEDTGASSWRYWSNDGLAYVDCELEENR